VSRGGDEQEPVHALSAEGTVISLFLFTVAVGVSHDQGITRLLQHVFGAADHGRKKGIGDVWKYHAHRLGLTGPEAPGNRVGVVLQIPDGSKDALPAFGSDIGSAVDDVGNRGGGDLGPRSDVLDGCHSSKR
jgi:hypothetical protein